MADPTAFDFIDAGAKIAAVGGVLWGVWRGVQLLRLARDQKGIELHEADRVAKTEEAKFWLELRARFDEHKDIHVMLRNNQWPDEPEDMPWPELEAYLGLMEHCQVMIKNGLLDFQTYNEIYGYRLVNVVQSPSIRQKLQAERAGWKNLLKLYERICEARQLHPQIRAEPS